MIIALVKTDVHIKTLRLLIFGLMLLFALQWLALQVDVAMDHMASYSRLGSAANGCIAGHGPWKLEPHGVIRRMM